MSPNGKTENQKKKIAIMKKKRYINPEMLDDDIADEDLDDGSSSASQPLIPGDILDKQLQIIREGNAFLEKFEELMARAEATQTKLAQQLGETVKIKVGLHEDAVRTLNSVVAKSKSEASAFTASVTKLSAEEMGRLRLVYTEVGNKMKENVDSYLNARMESTSKEMERRCSQFERKSHGHMMSNYSYYLHWVLFVSALIFGLWGVWQFWRYEMSEYMEWYIFAAITFNALIRLIMHLSDK